MENHSSKRLQWPWNTKYRYKAHSTKNEDKGSSTHVHKTTNQFKSSAQDNHFQRVATVWQLFQRTSTSFQVDFKLHGQHFQNSWQHTEQQQNMLWSSAAGISHLIKDHLNPITATSLDHTSTLVQNDQQQNKEQNKALCRIVQWVHKCPTSYKWHQNSNNIWNWWHRNAKQWHEHQCNCKTEICKNPVLLLDGFSCYLKMHFK